MRMHWSLIPGGNAGLENSPELVLEQQGVVLRSSNQCVKLVMMTPGFTSLTRRTFASNGSPEKGADSGRHRHRQRSPKGHPRD